MRNGILGARRRHSLESNQTFSTCYRLQCAAQYRILSMLLLLLPPLLPVIVQTEPHPFLDSGFVNRVGRNTAGFAAP